MGVSNQKSYRLPYKIYVATITQNGEGNPDVEVMENTLGGNVVWTRESEGRYRASLTGGFIGLSSFKVVVFINNSSAGGVYPQGIALYDWGGSSDDYLNFTSTTLDGTTLQDTVIAYCSIEIRVYP